MFDVLIYLVENYLDDNVNLSPNYHTIKTELQKAGFTLSNVNLALKWLASLDEHPRDECHAQAFRIFSEVEKKQLDLNCRNLLIALEHNGILSANHREIVIESTLVLENQVIDLQALKWIILMVLLTQADDEIAYLRMENIVYDLPSARLH
jgi:Smg protein